MTGRTIVSGMTDEDKRKRIETANEQMFKAAKQGDIAGIEAALNSGADICALDNDGWTVAMWAAWKGHLTPELVEYLVKRGCPMDARNYDGETVAMIAAQGKCFTPELVECLAKNGCPMDAKDNNGWTVAVLVTRYGHLTPELVECLVKHGCPMDARDSRGRTVAMSAAYTARNGSFITSELFECLVKNGCPMAVRDYYDWTFAMHAASSGHLTPELVECLVRHGCPIDDSRIGKAAAEKDQLTSFAAWAVYVPSMALRVLSSFSNEESHAAGILVLLSSDIPFDEKVFCSLAETFSKSRGGAVEHLLGDKDIFRAIGGARFLELVCSGNVLETPMNVARACNLLSMCRSLLDERPEKLDVVKTALLKTFAATLEACANDPEVAGLLQETMGRMAAIEGGNSYSGDEIPC